MWIWMINQGSEVIIGGLWKQKLGIRQVQNYRKLACWRESSELNAYGRAQEEVHKDSLVEEAEKSIFVLEGRNDILTATIGISEHGGRVRGVGKHHKQRTYFGRSSSRQGQHIDVNEQFAQISSELEEKFELILIKSCVKSVRCCNNL
ncbi:hypothetical protein RYX36_021112 [Vicia faba]